MSCASEVRRIQRSQNDVRSNAGESLTEHELLWSPKADSMKSALADLNAGGRLLVISPHLDDAVFSCEALLGFAQNVHVLTIFGGDAPPGMSISDWDLQCGFSEGTNVMKMRRQEDARALGELGAIPIWGEELQEGYRLTPVEQDRVTALISTTIETLSPSHVLFPLGLSHADHLTVASACVSAVRAHRISNAFVYAERPYAQRKIGIVGPRRRQIGKEGAELAPEALPRDARHGNRHAIQCYPSQLRGLKISAFRMGLFRERYWRITWRDA